jgi:hypothetical protein
MVTHRRDKISRLMLFDAKKLDTNMWYHENKTVAQTYREVQWDQCYMRSDIFH